MTAVPESLKRLRRLFLEREPLEGPENRDRTDTGEDLKSTQIDRVVARLEKETKAWRR